MKRQLWVLILCLALLVPAGLSAGYPWIIGHRGARYLKDENTIPSMELALARGANAVEMDVRLTSDGVPVIMHDDDVDRTTGGQGKVCDMTAGNFCSLRTAQGYRPPTLEQVLQHFSGRPVTLFLEIKGRDPRMLPALLDALRRHPAARVAVFAPDADFLYDLKLRNKRVQTFLPPVRYATAVAKALSYRCDGLIVVDNYATRWFIMTAHAAGLKVVAARVREPEEVVRALGNGADGVLVNDPRIMAEAWKLKARP